METSSTSALKEWAAIEQVLATGKSALLLRKGGLWERRDGFEMEHRAFWIYPTLFHQNPQELRPEFVWALDSARAAHPDGDRVRLEHYAEVTEAYRVEDLATIGSLAPYHALTEDTIDARFRYRNRPYLHALVLRIHRVPTPHIIPNTLGYEGCVSWVDLDDALPLAGAQPVLDEAQFQRIRDTVVGILEGAPGVVTA